MKYTHEDEKLEKLIGENVSVTLFDGYKIRGILKYSEQPGRYQVGNVSFRKSHIRKIKRTV